MPVDAYLDLSRDPGGSTGTMPRPRPEILSEVPGCLRVLRKALKPGSSTWWDAPVPTATLHMYSKNREVGDLLRLGA